MIGIYKIFNNVNGKYYIGSAIDIDRRLKRHKFLLTKNLHINRKLQNAYNKYGANCFIFQHIESCEKSQLLIREGYYIGLYNSILNGYNIELVDLDGNKNRYMSNTTKKKIHNALIGRHFSVERKINISNAKIGKKLTELHKANISKSVPDGHMKRIQELSTQKTSVGVVQLDKRTDTVINEYGSISEASRKTGICPTYILNACKCRKNKTEYVWIYK